MTQGPAGRVPVADPPAEHRVQLRPITCGGGGAASVREPPFRTGHSLDGRDNYGRRMANRYKYTVVELREGMIGGKMSGDMLEKVLNEHAAQGWQLKAIISVEVKGRVGPGGVEGLLVTFEQPVG